MRLCFYFLMLPILIVTASLPAFAQAYEESELLNEIKQFEEMLSEAIVSQNFAKASEIALDIADNYDMLGDDTGKTEQYHATAIQLAKKATGNYGALGDAYWSYAIFYDMFEPKLAVAYFDSAARSYRMDKQMDMYLQTMIRAGVNFGMLEQYNKGIKMVEDALKIAKEQNLNREVKNCLEALGKIYMFKGDEQSSKQYYALASGNVIVEEITSASSENKVESFTEQPERNSQPVKEEIQPTPVLAEEVIIEKSNELDKEEEVIREQQLALEEERKRLEKARKKNPNSQALILAEKRNKELEDELNEGLVAIKAEKELLERKLITQQKEREAEQKVVLIAGASGLLLLLIISIALIARSKANNKLRLYNQEILQQKGEIEAQKEEIESQRDEIERQSKRADELLFNILPAKVANELKLKNKVTPQNYDNATVLFTDFKNFTQYAERLSSTELVRQLNECFMTFDSICDNNRLEKIKTIGDAYMCAGGIPQENETHAIDAVLAGLQMQKFVEEWQQENKRKGDMALALRVGIHTGPLVAGVVGKRKFAYDIWGDTVNIASRMESSGEPGRVNISFDTYQLVKKRFYCTYRGKISAKNKGDIDMYFVEDMILSSHLKPAE